MTIEAPPPAAARRFDTLDALRGICAIFVAICHFSSPGLIKNLPIFRSGWLFVDYFFVLSGFVIAFSYGDRLTSRSIGLGRFLGLRLGRLYPLHVVMLAAFASVEIAMLVIPRLAAMAAHVPFTGSRSLGSLVASLLFLQTFNSVDELPWNSPSWSIAAEMWAYLLFGLIFLLPRRYVLAGVTAVLTISLAWVVARHPSLEINAAGGAMRCFLGFSTGVLVYHAFRKFPAKLGSPEEIAAVVAALLFVSLAEGKWTFLAPFVFGVGIYVLAHENGIVSKFLCRKTFSWLGMLSYSIYMTHSFVQARIGDAINLFNIMPARDVGGQTVLEVRQPTGDLMMLTMIGLLLGFSWLTYSFVENPGRQFSRRLFGREKTPSKVAEAV